MILSGQLPFGENALPSWMYHAQVPPPKHEWVSALAGITWVDLVFPFFLFAMGASMPLALTRRLEQGVPKFKIVLGILERGFLLAFFALYVEAIRPSVIRELPSTGTWLVGLLGFVLLFPILTRLPSAWSASLRCAIRVVGWLGAVVLLARLRYPGGGGFALGRSDIIIVVLANMAVFGSLIWWLTRSRPLVRLGLLGILVAIRLSNMPHPIEGWVSQAWQWSPAPWIYKLYYLQYLFIIIPGTFAGELLLDWLRGESLPRDSTSALSSIQHGSAIRFIAVGLLMVALPVLLVTGLKARWLLGSTLVAFGLCALGGWLLWRPANTTERLFQRLFNWATYWLVLGLVFEPYEGGIKKDRATMSYYFVTSGLAICVLIGLMILIDLFRRRRWVHLLIQNGQNPMIAYAGINNLILPLVVLTGADSLLSARAASPWMGFLRAVIITLILALSVSCFTKLRVFWRT